MVRGAQRLLILCKLLKSRFSPVHVWLSFGKVGTYKVRGWLPVPIDELQKEEAPQGRTQISSRSLALELCVAHRGFCDRQELPKAPGVSLGNQDANFRAVER